VAGTDAFVPHGRLSNLTIVALLPSETYDTRRGLVEYNLVFFKVAVREILDVEAARRLRSDPAADVS